jgi:hypothetical protein
METTSIILAGTGVIQSLLLLLLLQPTEENMNETVQKEYDSFMKLQKGSSSTVNTREFIRLVSEDHFREDVYRDSDNWTYLAILKKLKESIVGFYFTKIQDVESLNMDLQIIADVNDRIGHFILQLMKLRLVIQPDVQISMNVHPRTNIKYLAIKAYWIDDNGKKIRKFTKSIGRAENYPKGIKDDKALTDGIKLIQPVIFEAYKEEYPG